MKVREYETKNLSTKPIWATILVWFLNNVI